MNGLDIFPKNIKTTECFLTSLKWHLNLREYKVFGPSKALSLAKKGIWDGSILFYPFEELKPYFDFSKYEFNDEIVLFSLKKNSLTWKNINDLKDRSICFYYPKYILPNYLKGTYGLDPNKISNKAIFKDSFHQCLVPLLTGRVDFIADSKVCGSAILKENFFSIKRKISFNSRPLNSKYLKFLLLSKKIAPKREKIL